MAANQVTLEFPDLPALAGQFRKLPGSLAAAAIGTALKKALQPANDKLKTITPVGRTGNLKRSIAIKPKRYPKTKSAVAIVGFRRPNSSKPPKSPTKRRNRPADKSQHQLLVEYGSRPRFNKSGASRGRMPVIGPIAQASAATMSAVKGNLEREMTKAYENAVKQLPKFMAARAAKGRS